MDSSSGSVAAMVFKPVIRDDLGSLSLNGQMLSVLMGLDGRLTLGQIARKTGISLVEVNRIITKLTNLKLVRESESHNFLDAEFIDFLIARMSLAIGPLGEVIVEEGLAEFGFGRENFPSLRAAELVNFLSRDILRQDRLIEFKQAMLKKIQDKGY